MAVHPSRRKGAYRRVANALRRRATVFRDPPGPWKIALFDGSGFRVYRLQSGEARRAVRRISRGADSATVRAVLSRFDAHPHQTPILTRRQQRGRDSMLAACKTAEQKTALAFWAWDLMRTLLDRAAR
jgi:hypothetical protein